MANNLMLANFPNNITEIREIIAGSGITNSELAFYETTASQEMMRGNNTYRRKAQIVRNVARGELRMRSTKRTANIERAALERRRAVATARAAVPNTVIPAPTKKPLPGKSPLGMRRFTRKNK